MNCFFCFCKSVLKNNSIRWIRVGLLRLIQFGEFRSVQIITFKFSSVQFSSLVISAIYMLTIFQFGFENCFDVNTNVNTHFNTDFNTVLINTDPNTSPSTYFNTDF